MSNIYQRLAQESVPRLFSFFDTNPQSATYGSGDRSFWHYRTLTNFSGATWQQPMLGFAVLYTQRRDGNIWAGDARMLAHARAALAWWARIQHADGSFDEWYLNERSYCPTAFTAAAAALTVIELGAALPANEREFALLALLRAGAFLKAHHNEVVANQNVAAALALFAIGRISGDPRWEAAATEKYQRIARAQSDEGWLPEYGGPDFGYSTLAVDLLAAADRLGNRDAHAIALPVIDFLAATWDDGPVYPARLGSRATPHLFAAGVGHFSNIAPTASALASAWRAAHAASAAPGPPGVDDRYLSYFYFNAFVLAAAWTREDSVASRGELVGRTPRSYSVHSGETWKATLATHSGALALRREGRPVHYNLGYEVSAGLRQRLSSAGWHDGGASKPSEVSSRRAAFRTVFAGRPLERWAIPFHVTTQLLWLPGVSGAFQALVKRQAVLGRAGSSLSLERTVLFENAVLTVVDIIRGRLRLTRRATINIATKIAAHSPSALQESCVALTPRGWNGEAVAARLASAGAIKIEWCVDLDREHAEPEPAEVSELA